MENLIKAWKENWLPWCKVSDEMKEVAGKLTKSPFLFWYHRNAEWRETKYRGLGFDIGVVYRLPEDFKCPHTDTIGMIPIYEELPKITDRKCLWCGEEVQDKPKVGWVEYPIAVASDTHIQKYEFSRNGAISSLCYGSGMVGFGGIKYRYPCGDETGFIMTAPDSDDELGPCTPVAVRFWEAMK